MRIHSVTPTAAAGVVHAVFRDPAARGGLRRLRVVCWVVVSPDGDPNQSSVEAMVLWPGARQPEPAFDFKGFLGLARRGDGVDWKAAAALDAEEQAARDAGAAEAPDPPEAGPASAPAPAGLTLPPVYGAGRLN